eukprot:jgi/Picsp_1/4146/NSC_01655-R1_---NA---
MDSLRSFFSKYKTGHITRGLQMSIGVAILFAVTLGPGNKKSIEMAITAEIYAALCCLAPVSGFAPLVIILCALVLVILLGFIPALGYIAIGFGKELSTDKAVTLTVVACVFFFAMHLVRVRFPSIGPIGLLVQVLMSANLTAIYWSSGDPSPLHLVGDAGEYLGYALGALTVVYYLIVPIPTGTAISSLMVALMGVVEKMNGGSGGGGGGGEKNGDDAGNNKSNKSNGYNGDAAINLESCMALDSKAGELLAPLNSLLLASKIDLNVYGRPHIFPTESFRRLHQRIGFLSRLMVHRSRFDRKGIPGIKSLHAAEQVALESIKASLLTAPNSSYIIINSKADAADEEHWNAIRQHHHVLTLEVHAMLALLVDETSTAKREAIMVEGVGGWLLTKALEELPGCLPNNAAGCKGISPVDTLDWNFIGSVKAREALQLAVEEAFKDLETQLETTPYELHDVDDNGGSAGRFTPSPPQAAAPTPHRHLVSWFLFKMAEATGFHRHMFILSCQTTGAFLVGCILNFNSTTFKALGDELLWVFFAIINVTVTTYSGALHKARQRLCGTAVAVAVVSLVTAFNYLVAGLSYKSTPLSLGLSCTLLAIYTGVALATREALNPRFQYAFFIAIWTPLLLFTYDLDGSDSSWGKFGYRLANNMIGVGLVTVFQFVYPVTSRTYIRHTVAEILKEVACCVDGLVGVLQYEKNQRDKVLFKHNANIEKNLLTLDQLRGELDLEKEFIFAPPRWFQQGSRLSAQEMQDRMAPLMLELRSELVEFFVAAAVANWYVGAGVVNTKNDDDGNIGNASLNDYAQSIRAMRLLVLGMKTREEVEKELNALESSLKQFLANGALQEDVALAAKAAFARRGIARARKLIICIDRFLE